MKNFWTLSLMVLCSLILLYLIINHFFYGSLVELIAAVIILGFLTIQFGICSIYFILRFRQYALIANILHLFILGIIGVSTLFVFNASLWDTSTGKFRNIYEIKEKQAK